MSLSHTIITYFITLVVFLALDSLWLVKVAPKVYQKYIGHLMAKKPNLLAAIIFYAAFVVGILVFVLIPSINEGSLARALGYGALFGLFTYATFDLTSQAVFKKWPTAITVIDMLWGVILTTATCAVSYYLVNLFNL